MNLYKDVNLAVVEDGYKINTIASIIQDNRGLRYIDFINWNAYELKVLKVWPHLAEAFEKNNIDSNIIFNDIKDKLPIFRIGQGNYYEFAYAFNYNYFSNLDYYSIYNKFEYIKEIDFVITSQDKIAFKSQEDLEAATTILALLGK